VTTNATTNVKENVIENVTTNGKANVTAADSRPVLLQADGLSKAFDLERSFARRTLDWWHGRQAETLRALDKVSFVLHTEEVLGVLGESGSGKSTLARILMGLISPDSGTASLGERDLFASARAERLEILRRMQIVFQDPFSSLDPRMTIRQILLEPLQIHGHGRPEDWSRRLNEGIQEVGLAPEILDRYPAEFSGGQRQRIGICRALMLEPILLIADEAVSALDVSIQAQILELLQRLRASRKLAMIFISHDVAVVRQLADRVLVLFQGRLVEIMPADCLLTDACHPYSRRLIQAALRLREGSPGDEAGSSAAPEDVGHLIANKTVPGCLLQGNCPHQLECCREPPPLFPVHPQHQVACWKFGKNHG
jgi:peptide/nickel transport system ATP-binding protein